MERLQKLCIQNKIRIPHQSAKPEWRNIIDVETTDVLLFYNVDRKKHIKLIDKLFKINNYFLDVKKKLGKDYIEIYIMVSYC